MRCPHHGLATAPDGKCVRCRQADDVAVAEAHEELQRPGRRRGAALGAALVTGGVAAVAIALVLARPHGASSTTGTAGSASADPPEPSITAKSAAPLVPLAPAEVDASDVKRAAPAASAETALARATREVVIVLFCRPGVPDCTRARQWMIDRGYAYVDRDVDVDPEAEKLCEKIGGGTVPAFDIDGQRFAGFDSERLTNAMTYAAAKRLQR